jgi:hypothetical protein
MAWKIIAASEPGTAHSAAGSRCQDSYAAQSLPGDALVIAVSDGAGSARCAAEGSAAAAGSAARYLADRLTAAKPATAQECRILLADCLAKARSQIDSMASEANPIGEFAATLLAVFATDDFIGAVQIGDGAVVCRESAGPLRVLCRPQHGEYLNETCFLTSQDFSGLAEYSVQPSGSVDAIAAFTDGLEMLALMYPGVQAHAPFFNPLFRFACASDASGADLSGFLSSDRVCERTDDDKTLVLAVRIPGAQEAES